MKIHARIKPNAKVESVELIDGVYVICVKAPPAEGKANEAAVRLIAKHIGTSKTHVRLVSGGSSRYKTFEVD